MTAVAISSTEILITWYIVPPIDQNGVIKFSSYRLYWNYVKPGYRRLFYWTTVYGQRTLRFRPAHENVEYIFRVRAYSSVGSGPSSDEVIVRTPEDGMAS